MGFPLQILKGAPMVCQTLYCTSMKAIYHIGRADAEHFINGYYCAECIRHLANNIPTELIEGGEDLEQRLRREITEQYEAKLTELETAITAKVTADLIVAAAAAAKPVVEEEKPVTTEWKEEDAAEQDVEYRCLDCDQVFDTKRKLTYHKKECQVS